MQRYHHFYQLDNWQRKKGDKLTGENKKEPRKNYKAWENMRKPNEAKVPLPSHEWVP